MHGTLQKRGIGAREIDRSEFRDTEENFGSTIGDVARLLWPKATAAEVASRAGCSVRNIELCLSPTNPQKWSGDAIAVIVGEILRRHGMRNVRVTGRK